MAPSRSGAGQSSSSSAVSIAVNETPNQMTATPPISVLFVCLGNICRSPMAEAVFRSLTSVDPPRVTIIDSAGTGAYHAGDSPDPRTMSTLEDNHILDYDHAARKVRNSDFTTFDYILAMDKENLHDLQRLRQRVLGKDGATQGKGKVVLFGDFGGRQGEEVVDPYYGARNGFEVAYEQMVRFSRGFIEEVLDGAEPPTGALHGSAQECLQAVYHAFRSE